MSAGSCARCGRPIDDREAYLFNNGDHVTEFCEDCFTLDVDACFDTHVDRIQADLKTAGLLPW